MKKKFLLKSIITFLLVIDMVTGSVPLPGVSMVVRAADDINDLTYNTTGGYYEINDAQDLVDLANYVNGGNNASGKTFKQTADIDMSNISNFTPIASKANDYNPTPFNGIYDGQGNAITGLTVDISSPQVGLFGQLGGGTVRNLTMVNPNIKANYSGVGSKNAGGIVGELKPGTVENCNVINPTLSTSSTNGEKNKGVICGLFSGSDANVSNCHYYLTTNYDAVGRNASTGTVTNTGRAYTLTLGDNVTTSTEAAFTYSNIKYYAANAEITLTASMPASGMVKFATTAGELAATSTVGQVTFTMPTQDATVSLTTVTPSITVDVIGLTYTGSEKRPDVTVEDDSTTLSAETDYTLSYSGNTNAGTNTATATITGKGLYLGTASQHFTIGQKEIGLTWGDTNFTYNGSEQAPTATATELCGSDSCTVTVTGGQVNVGENITATATELSNSNYKLPATGTTQTFTISPAAATVTADDKNKTYGVADSELTATVNGLVSSDTASVISYSLSRAEGENVGTYTITPTGDEAQGNYTVTYVPGTFTINKASAPSLAEENKPTARELTYNGGDQALVTEPTTSLTGFTLKYSTNNGSTWSETIPTGKAATNYTVKAKYFGGDNSEDSDEMSVNVTISPKSVTVNGITASNKTYDGTTTAKLVTMGATFDGICAGDTLTVNATGAFADANASDNDKSVTINGLTLSGSDKDNYVLADSGNQSTATAKINKKSVTVTAEDQTVALNETVDTSVSKATLTGAVEGHTLYSATLTADGTEHATTSGMITPSNAVIKNGDTDVTSNYNITYAAGTLTVSKADPDPTVPTGLTATYGQTLADVSLASDSNGAWAWDEPTTSVGGVGSHSFPATYTPTDTNYNTKKENLTVTVSKAENPVQVTGTASVTKGNHTVNLSEKVNGAEGTVSYAISSSLEGCSVDASTGVFTSGDSTGVCTVTVTIAGNENYDEKTATVTVTVTDKQTQTISFESATQTKTYGDADFTITATHSVGDGAVSYAVTDGTDVAQVDADGKVHILKVGTATITATTAATDDYAEASAQYTLTVNPKTITIPTAVSGLKYTGNEQTGVVAETGYTVTNGKATNVGSYTATAVLEDKTNTKWTNGSIEDQNIAWSIGKANGPAAPTGLTGTAPTTNGGSDGKITGVDNTMEYSDNIGFTSADDCTGTEITGLSAGTYYVRVKETTTHGAGAYATVTVPAYGDNSAKVKKAPTPKTNLVYNGSAQTLVEPGEAENGTMVYAVTKAGDPEPSSQLYTTSIPAKTDAGTYYVWYKVVSDNYNVPAAEHVEVTIGEGDIHKLSYDPNGGSGTMQDQFVTVGTETVLRKNSFTRNGYRFNGWNTKSNGSGTSYDDEGTITLSGHMVLYAQWKEVEKHTHYLELVSAVEAGCETEGHKAYYKCSGCDKRFKDAAGTVEITDDSELIIKALGHDWDSGEVTKEPTYTETGIKTYTCLRDGSHTKEEVIPVKKRTDSGSDRYSDSDDDDDDDDSYSSSGGSSGGVSGNSSSATGGSSDLSGISGSNSTSGSAAGPTGGPVTDALNATGTADVDAIANSSANAITNVNFNANVNSITGAMDNGLTTGTALGENGSLYDSEHHAVQLKEILSLSDMLATIGNSVTASGEMNLNAGHHVDAILVDDGMAISDVGGTWSEASDNWHYKKADGTEAKNEWLNLSYNGVTSWYFFDEKGDMATGWVDHKGERYFLVPETDGWKGRMAVGWVRVDEKWYYLEPGAGSTQGHLVRNGFTPDGHYVGEDGALVW